ncbi:hypothetical protein [Halococcus saccharolyticus]|nr:hypothetical protein [Halococcus saccharolyticus]
MTEYICGKCDAEAESQWAIRLEHGTDERTYRLCRGCWDELNGRFGEGK